MFLFRALVLVLLIYGYSNVYSQAFGRSRITNATDSLNSRHQLTSLNSPYQLQSGMVVAEDFIYEKNNFIRLKTENYGERNHLCAGQSFANSPAIKSIYCSATLVAPDIVVTAAHCLRTRSCQQMSFLFGLTSSDFEGPSDGFSNYINKQEHYFECQNVLEVGSGWTRQGLGQSTENDWAIIRLNRAVPGSVTLPYRRSGRLEVGESVKSIGNPRGLASIESFGSVKHRGSSRIGQNFITTSFYTESGNSGGGVFSGLDLFEGTLVETYDHNILGPFVESLSGCNLWRSQEEYRDLNQPRVGSYVVPVSQFKEALQRHVRTARSGVHTNSQGTRQVIGAD